MRATECWDSLGFGPLCRPCRGSPVRARPGTRGSRPRLTTSAPLGQAKSGWVVFSPKLTYQSGHVLFSPEPTYQSGMGSLPSKTYTPVRMGSVFYEIYMPVQPGSLLSETCVPVGMGSFTSTPHPASRAAVGAEWERKDLCPLPHGPPARGCTAETAVPRLESASFSAFPLSSP